MSNTMPRKQGLTDAEQAALQAKIASDANATEATDGQLAQAKTFAEVFPDMVEAIIRPRGRPVVTNPRKQISLRLDGDVVDEFKSTGNGWQTRVNEALQKAAGLEHCSGLFKTTVSV